MLIEVVILVNAATLVELGLVKTLIVVILAVEIIAETLIAYLVQLT